MSAGAPLNESEQRVTPQTEMSWRGKAGVAGVSGVGGASLPIENIKNFFPLEISRISSYRKLQTFISIALLTIVRISSH